MPLQPKVDLELVIGGIAYRIAEHPAAPGMPYGQEGRQAVVYQLAAPEGAKRALKVFKPRYRLPALATLADRLAAFADLPGLQVCRRTVLTPQRHAALLRQHSDLVYAVLMPWVEGPTWMEVLLEKRALSPEQCLTLARSLANLLATMEQRGLAHCDLSGPNVMLPALASDSPAPAWRERGPGGEGVALVDVEQLYGPGLDRPALLPGGSPGYAHRTAQAGLWGPDADRFAGAVLLAEMLAWCDERVREAAWGEGYFDPQEVQQEGARGRVLAQVLQERWGAGVAGLFERAWRSGSQADCATFGEWLLALPERVGETHEVTPQADDMGLLLTRARRLEREGQPAEALRLYREVLTRLPQGSPLRDEVAATVRMLAGQTGRPDAAALLVAKGQRLEREGDLAGALAAYREAWAKTPLGGLQDELALIARDLEWRVEAEASLAEMARQAAMLEQAGRWREAAEAYWRLASQTVDARKRGAWELAQRRCEAEAGLADLFDQGLTAYQQGEWAQAWELLAAVVRQRPDYARGGQRATKLVAEAERQLAASTRGPARRWMILAGVGAALGLLALAVGAVVLVGVAVISHQKTPTQIARVPPSVQAIQTPKPTATPPPALAGTPVPQPVAAISPNNAGQVVQLARWGKDVVLNEDHVYQWSPQGRWLAVRVVSGLRLYNGDTLQLERTVETGRYPVFSPDETLIASMDQDGKTIRLQDVPSRTITGTLSLLEGHQTPVQVLRFSPDGRLLLSLDERGTLHVWNTAERKSLISFAVGKTLDMLRVSTDNAYLMGVDDKHQFQVWDLGSGVKADSIVARFAKEKVLDVSEDTSTLVSLSNDGAIMARRFPEGTSISQLGTYTRTEGLPYVALSPKGKWAATEDTIWRVADGTAVLQIEEMKQKLQKRFVFNLYTGVFDASENYWAMPADSDDSPQSPLLWDLSSRSPILVSGNLLEWTRGGRLCVPSFRPDGTRVCWGHIGINGQIGVWKTPDGILLDTLDGDTGGGNFLIAFSSDKQLLTVDPIHIRLWNMFDGTIYKERDNPVELNIVLTGEQLILRTEDNEFKTITLPDLSGPSDPIHVTIPEKCAYDTKVGFVESLGSISRGLIAVGNGLALEKSCRDNSVVVLYYLEVPFEPTVYSLPGQFNFPNDLVFSPDGSLAVGLDNEVQLVRVPDLVLQRTFKLATGELRCIAFSPDRTSMAVSTSKGQVYVWQLSDGTLKYTLETGQKAAGRLAFSPDSRLLAVIAADTLQMWQVSDGSQLRSLDAPRALSVAFSPDGKLLASGAYDSTVRLWGVR